ncbi:RNAase G [[Mycoplasma] phocae]|uniref:RNAase G n=2 Tax=[Mycoplasma] phocae TaxID=142651 RepID=A0A2Z5IQV8_9BACT|nr:RNAase G [[Mycoplasma] phocae]
MGQITSIKAFKYDGTLYRQYEGAKIVANLDDFVVILLIKSKVAEDNISWVVSDPILFFFAKNRFYNAVVTLNKKKDNYIYINLASPFYIEDGIVKYIDFDIDIKSYVDKDFNVVDWQDFKKSITEYKYPLKLIYRIYDELDFLQEQHYAKSGIFSKKLIDNITRMLIESGDI